MLCVRYLRLSEPMPVPVTVPVPVVVDVAVVVVEPVFRVGMTAADSFSFSFSLSALSSDQYLFTDTSLYSCAPTAGVCSFTVHTVNTRDTEVVFK